MARVGRSWAPVGRFAIGFPGRFTPGRFTGPDRFSIRFPGGSVGRFGASSVDSGSIRAYSNQRIIIYHAPVESYKEVYLRAKRLLAEEPDKLLPELDQILGAADRDLGPRLERTVRLAEMALVAKLDPWWTGPFQSNIRNAVRKLSRFVHDPMALGLGLRLAVGYDDDTPNPSIRERHLRVPPTNLRSTWPLPGAQAWGRSCPL